MNIETIREYCLSKNCVSECMPFDENTLVFKVLGKMFLLTDLENDLWINVKCDPEYAIELREQYPSVIPGYHMNKKHWNTVYIDGFLSDETICSFIDHSYNLVCKSLPKKLQNELKFEQ
jgi:predicted DNA-binding protein (MmcQ/YjbR family)